MANGTRRGAALVAAIATALMLTLAGTGFAMDGESGGGRGGEGPHGEKCPFGEASGDGVTTVPGAGAPVNAYTWNVCRTGPEPTDVNGYFTATTPLVPAMQVPAPQGPVACAEFSGKTVSFYYLLNEKSNPPQLKDTAILIHGEDGGATDKQGFAGPLPPATFTGCGPGTPQSVVAQTTSLPASGITVTSPPSSAADSATRGSALPGALPGA